MRGWLAVFLVGCWTSSSSPPATPAPPEPIARSTRSPPRERTELEIVLDKFAEFRDAMCACTDRACAEQVSTEMTRWASEMADRDHTDLAPDETEQVTVLAEELARCMTRAFTGP